jgi:hypothetical protein
LEEIAWCRWRGGSGSTGGSSHRWQCYPLDRLGFGVGGSWAVNLVFLTTGPHLLFIALRDGGPPATSLGWTSPIRTRDKGPDKAVGPSPVEIKLTKGSRCFGRLQRKRCFIRN